MQKKILTKLNIDDKKKKKTCKKKMYKECTPK